MSNNDIRYVCISDLHLGERESVLTPLDAAVAGRPAERAPLLAALGACLRSLVADGRGPRPTLIVAGDGVDLSFSTYPEALTLFRVLIGALIDDGTPAFERILYVPGNHDHHIWELAREDAYAEAIERLDGDAVVPAALHVTGPREESTVPSNLLTSVARLASGGDAAAIPVRVAYPNLALLAPAFDRGVIVHHGHYSEEMYRFFTIVRQILFPDREPPLTVEEIESQNYAWVDFVWSHLGRSGLAGRDFEELFRTLRNPEQLRASVDDLTARIVHALDLPYLPSERLERTVIRQLFEVYMRRFKPERFVRETACSEETMRGLERYVFGPSYRQLEAAVGEVPADLSVVFGHTHKPFERLMYDARLQRRMAVFNCGGWTIDSHRPSEVVGASIVVMSESLDMASIRLYNDGPESGETAIVVRDAGEVPSRNAFTRTVATRMAAAASETVWTDFLGGVRAAIERRRAFHRAEAGA